MDDPPIVGVHRLHRHRSAGLDRLVREAAREIDERVLAAPAISLGVDDDARPVIGLLADDAIDDVLQRVERRALFPNNQARLGTVRVEKDPLAVVEGAHLGLDPHPVQDLPQGLGSSLALLGKNCRGRLRHQCPWRMVRT